MAIKKVVIPCQEITMNVLFSGIGSQEKAMQNLGIPFKVVGISEIDKYAIQSYEAIFGKTFNYGDITRAEKLNYADLWTYSFPCQDISVAGKQRGIKEGTLSGLLYEVQRLLEVAKEEKTLPKYLLLENVKNLVGKQFKAQFKDWISYLDELGYNTKWQVLNAKDYGIPQNRERVFALSIRKDIDKNFEFPQKEELKLRLEDLLESEVGEKYYLSQQQVDNFIKNGNLNCNPSGKGMNGKVCIDDTQGFDGVRVYNNYSPTLRANRSGLKVMENLRIRKLTPLEYWRLMGFSDNDFIKAKNSGVSNSQLYKQAGNSIVVKVIEKIFYNLLITEKNTTSAEPTQQGRS